MSPPELAADAPVPFLAEPVHVAGRVARREEFHFAVADGLHGVFGERVHLHEPLVAQERLDGGLRAVAVHQRDRAVLDLLEVAERLHVLDDPLASRKHRQPGVLPAVLVERAVRVQDVDDADLLVALIARIVVGIMSRRDLHATRPQCFVREQSIGNDRDDSPGQRNANMLADEMRVPLVGRMHADGGVAEHRFGAGGGEGNALAGFVVAWLSRAERFGLLDTGESSYDHRIIKRPKMPRDVLVEDFVIGDCRLQVRVPIDQPLASIDQPIAEELEERAADGSRADVIEREPHAPPIAACSEHFLLADYPLFKLVLPFPDPFDERLAADIVPCQFFFFEHPPLNDRLSRNTGVIGAGHPERLVPLHPSPASQQVLHSPVERMPHVQRPGHVRQRNHDRVRLLRMSRISLLSRRIRVEIAALLPKRKPLGLSFFRIVLLGEFCHGVWNSLMIDVLERKLGTYAIGTGATETSPSGTTRM